LAIANPSDTTKAAERSCAALYAKASSEYTDCLAYKVGLIAGDNGDESAVANATSTLRPPVRFCRQDGHYVNDKIKNPKTCTKPITCLLDAAIGKYRCADAMGASIDPPGPICQTEPAEYACDVATQTPPLEAGGTGIGPEGLIGEATSSTSPAQD